MAQDMVDALYVLNHKYERSPEKYQKIADKVKMYIAQDMNKLDLEQITSLMELYAHN